MNEEVIKKLYDDNLHKIISWVKKNSGNEEDGKDIFQEGLTTLLFIDDWKNKDLNAYLFSICKFKWIDEIRRNKKQNKVRSREEIRYNNDRDIETKIIEAEEKREQHELLEAKFQLLSDLCRKLITLLREGKNPKEIVTHLNMENENTVYRRKFACMKRWKELVLQNK